MPLPELPALPAPDILDGPLFAHSGITLGVLRLDRLHPLWGGNKVFKLQPNIRRALALGVDRLISFGGAHSNHLHALAAYGREYGLRTVGIVRGEAAAVPSPTLRDALAWGMTLRHVSRADYRRRDDPAWVERVTHDLQPALVIPEGGDNAAGFAGARALGQAIAAGAGHWDLLAVACGTGTTLAGLAAGGDCPVLGFAALRDADGIARRAAAHLAAAGLGSARGYRVLDRFAGRGFARVTPELLEFIAAFERSDGIALDPVYTGKLFMGLHVLAAEGCLAPGTRVLAVHTGGLQGARAMAQPPCASA